MEARYLKEQLEAMLGGVEIFLDFLQKMANSPERYICSNFPLHGRRGERRWAEMRGRRAHPSNG